MFFVCVCVCDEGAGGGLSVWVTQWGLEIGAKGKMPLVHVLPQWVGSLVLVVGDQQG